MGCEIYHIEVPHSWSADQPESEISSPVYLSLGEREDVRCLCTFPHNYREDPALVPVRSLALLGAAVVLASREMLQPYDERHSIVDVLPAWIIEGIKAKTPDE